MAGSSFQILIVEDDPEVAESLQQGLVLEHFQTVWKNTKASGIEYAKTHSPDLIILDVRLPDGSGFDFCRQFRQEGGRQPILMLTARREELDKVLGLEMGADDYMTKPFSLRELIARIRAMLRRAYGDYAAKEGQENILHAGEVTILLDTTQVKLGSRLLNLTPTEYRLLVYLVRQAGKSVSRAQILDEVWDDYYGVESERTVNVHIRRLREKIEIDPGKPRLILTVPGIGYRLAVD